MRVQDILLIYEYNYWVNGLLLDRCEALTEEQFTASHNNYSFDTIQRTMIHILDAEWSWRLTMQGNPPDTELSVADFPTLAALHERWTNEKNITWEWLHTLKDENLDGIISYPVPGGIRERVLWHCLYHVANHGTQHRSEVAEWLTGYGQSPGDIDFTLFLRIGRNQMG